MPGAISVVLSINSKLAPGQAAPKRITAGVEKDALTTIFNERGVSPVLLHGGRLAEGVVENGDLRLARAAARRSRRRGRRGASGEKHGQCCKTQVTHPGL